jgi:hypothetical protein
MVLGFWARTKLAEGSDFHVHRRVFTPRSAAPVERHRSVRRPNPLKDLKSAGRGLLIGTRWFWASELAQSRRKAAYVTSTVGCSHRAAPGPVINALSRSVGAPAYKICVVPLCWPKSTAGPSLSAQPRLRWTASGSQSWRGQARSQSVHFTAGFHVRFVPGTHGAGRSWQKTTD